MMTSSPAAEAAPPAGFEASVWLRLEAPSWDGRVIQTGSTVGLGVEMIHCI